VLASIAKKRKKKTVDSGTAHQALADYISEGLKEKERKL